MLSQLLTECGIGFCGDLQVNAVRSEYVGLVVPDVVVRETDEAQAKLIGHSWFPRLKGEMK